MGEWVGMVGNGWESWEIGGNCQELVGMSGNGRES